MQNGTQNSKRDSVKKQAGCVCGVKGIRSGPVKVSQVMYGDRDMRDCLTAVLRLHEMR